MFFNHRLIGRHLLLLPLMALLGSAQTGGSISGIVVDEAERPVPRATIRYSKRMEFTRGADGRPRIADPGFSREVASGPDGRFSTGSLQPGKYLVCAAGPQPNDVGSCNWRALPYITVGSGQQVSGQVLVIRQGVRVTFRVADPQNRVQLPDIRGFVPDRARRLRVIVISGDIFRNAEPVGRLPGELILQALVPARQPASFSLDTDLGFTDETGASIRRGVAVPVPIRLAAIEAIIRLNVN